MLSLLLTLKTFNLKTLIPVNELKPVSEIITESAGSVIPALKPVFSKAGKAFKLKLPTVVNWSQVQVDKMVLALNSKTPETNCKVEH